MHGGGGGDGIVSESRREQRANNSDVRVPKAFHEGWSANMSGGRSGGVARAFGGNLPPHGLVISLRLTLARVSMPVVRLVVSSDTLLKPRESLVALAPSPVLWWLMLSALVGPVGPVSPVSPVSPNWSCALGEGGWP